MTLTIFMFAYYLSSGSVLPKTQLAQCSLAANSKSNISYHPRKQENLDGQQLLSSALICNHDLTLTKKIIITKEMTFNDDLSQKSFKFRFNFHSALKLNGGFLDVNQSIQKLWHALER